MKKKDDEVSQKISLEDDMDIFDELESGDSSTDSSIEASEVDEDKTEPDSPVGLEDQAPEDKIENEAEEMQIQPQDEFSALPEIDDELPEPAVDEPASVALADELMKLAPDIPVNIVAVIGKTMSNIGEVVKYRPGHVIDLARPPSETVDLVANGKLIARGELVDMDGKLGVRILKLLR